MSLLFFAFTLMPSMVLDTQTALGKYALKERKRKKRDFLEDVENLEKNLGQNIPLLNLGRIV